MGYYRGDYYRGDYYRGDFLGIGKAIKKVGRIVGGVIKVGTSLATGGPIAAAGTALALVGRKPGPMIGAPVTPPFVGVRVGGPLGFQMGYQGAGVSGEVEQYRGVRGSLQYSGDGVPRGYHLAKDGSGRLVRNRRMNVTNPRALRRSIRRARGFAKLARKVLSFPISKPPKGRALFKKRSR